ncbi:MAG TPA: class I SAM-dependent methyltransferase [Lysobacter sp.]|nr:class I SAM-dependent methyltransferase [Lysobacter sp.]
MLLRKLRELIKLALGQGRTGFSSAAYWEARYSGGGNSGDGSYGHLAAFKAGVINEHVARHGIKSVIEFGCGDGNQLKLAEYAQYVGYDVSSAAVRRCRGMFGSDRSKSFHLAGEYDGQTADLAISIDVIFHLVEDSVYDEYMRRLFQAARDHVIIYSSNEEKSAERESRHVRHRHVTAWIDREMSPTWTLEREVPNPFPFDGDNATGSFANFYIYRRSTGK